LNLLGANLRKYLANNMKNVLEYALLFFILFFVILISIIFSPFSCFFENKKESELLKWMKNSKVGDALDLGWIINK